MAIIKTKDTRYYELDWQVMPESNEKVYMAIKGNIEKDTIMGIMAAGIGYLWREQEGAQIKVISKEEFLKEARNDNIVYFYEDDNNYNVLLNYPKDMQKYIDIELYKDGFKPHNAIPVMKKLEIIKAKHETSKIMKTLAKQSRER